MNIDITRLLADLSNIVTGLRARDWQKVLAAAGDILAMIAGTPLPAPVPPTMAMSRCCATLANPELLTLDELATELETLATEAGATNASILTNILVKVITAILQKIIGGVI